MLSRTADHLFWMARYTERAENTARMLDVTYQMSLLPQTDKQAAHNWGAVLSISELRDVFDHFYKKLTAENVVEFMVWDTRNPSSILSCLRSARENAHAVRGKLTTEVWETHNATWLDMQKKAKKQHDLDEISDFFDWVKFRSHVSRGVTIGTTLKDEAFYFIRLGTFLERADNTARILDVKYHALPSDDKHAPRFSADYLQDMADVRHEWRNGDPYHDFYHWNALLRSVSGFEIYRRVYRDVITPARVAELLVLREDMPRSLVACMSEVVNNLRHIRNTHSAETERRAGLLHSELQYGRVVDILDTSLHFYLTRFLERVNDLGARISKDFLLPA